jgi:hypothetical protein
MPIELIVSLLQHTPWFNIITAAVTAASTIAAVTPTPKAGTKLATAYKVIDLLAVNVGKAKQK